MRMITMGSYRIFRPRKRSESKILSEEAEFIYSKMSPGRYSSVEEINSFIQSMFAFHRKRLDTAIARLANRQYLTFLLWQYDESHKILMAARQGQLTADQTEYWFRDGPNIRRALKFLIELTCSLNLSAPDIEDEEELVFITEQAQIAAEECVRFSILSESTFALFPKETELVINAKGPDVIELRVHNDRFNDLNQRHTVDGKNRHRFMNEEGSFSFERDKEVQDKFIGDAFENAHGIRYSRAIEILGYLVEFENPENKNAFDGCYYHKDEFIDGFSAHLQLSRDVVTKIFAGFSILPELIGKSGETWNPKRLHGANCRAIFEVPHLDGTCIAWSREMVGEALEAMLQASVFQKLPEQWNTTAAIKKGLEKLSQARGRWFEQVTEQNLVKLGFNGRSWSAEIGSLAVPSDVGEIDYVGYSATEKRLLIIECKMTLRNTESRLWRDDFGRFVNDEKSYAKKFRRKRDWVVNNLHRICEELSALSKSKVEPEAISVAMVTNYPNIASCIIDDFPCISLTELMMAAAEMKSWPYAIGTISCC